MLVVQQGPRSTQIPARLAVGLRTGAAADTRTLLLREEDALALNDLCKDQAQMRPRSLFCDILKQM